MYNRKHQKIYIGQTINIALRELLHHAKTFDNSYTARFDGEWEIIYKEAIRSRQQALIREKQLKSYRGRLFIKKFIKF